MACRSSWAGNDYYLMSAILAGLNLAVQCLDEVDMGVNFLLPASLVHLDRLWFRGCNP